MYRDNNDGFINKIDECLSFPKDENNRHYIQYLKWVEQGGKVITTPTLDPLKVTIDSLLQDVNKYYCTIISRLNSDVGQQEKDTWSMKSELAHCILSGKKQSVEQELFLKAAGISDPKVWANKVKEKSLNHVSVLGIAESFRSAHKKNISKISDIDAAKEYAQVIRNSFSDTLIRFNK